MNGQLTVSIRRIQQTQKRKEILDERYSKSFKLKVKGTSHRLPN